ncbi:ferredoxin [Streptomyces sp. NPDC050560]|uniref:ferredoxin n=1 Tax=Streptomyces sp. NPDC050560 TaxID=3365630 RepID=UPI0037B87FDA
MTFTTRQAEDRTDLVRFLEEGFACAQACADCARVCAGRVSFAAPGAGGAGQELRRQAVLCTEVCDATCALLSEQTHQDEYALRVQVEWCRAMCLECAHVCDRCPGAEDCAAACRACARACTDFLAVLA